MNTQPKFAIAYRASIHDDRDAIVGSVVRLVEGRPAFHTAGLAHRLVGQMNDYDAQHGGDGDYLVWDLTERRQHFVYPAETLAALECPF